ncbi:translocation/assembly module TamB domain-containing protein [Niveispirillum sp. KHB5.9]|uniref:translocation/assembly module TamB domain-containing protein n=1 Tax=Niveispirillum sp. KHB5.9 TaxID=3400269 RepID=UPI003A896046
MDKTTNMRAILIWIAAGLAGLVALVLLIAVSSGIWLATPSGRDFVLAQAQSNVPGLVAEGASGSVFDLRLARLTMADANGVWLTVTDAHLAWNPWPLFSRTLSIDTLTATSVDVARQPLPQPEDPNDTGALPQLPVSVHVAELALAKVNLGAELLGGSPAVLTVAGQAKLPAGELGGAGTLDIKRIDDRPGTLTVAGAYVAGRRLTLAVEATEQGNGLLAEMLDIPGRPPVTLTLKGEGPLTDWTGSATAKAGDVVDAKAEFRIRPSGSKLTFGLDLSGNMQAMLPPAIRPLVGPDLRIGAGGLIDPGVKLALDGVGISAAFGKISGGGAFDIKTRAINVGAWVELPDGAILAPLTAPASLGAARGSITLTGTPEVPQVATDLTLDNVGLPDLLLKSMGVKLVTKGLDPVEVIGDVRMEGASGPLAALTGPKADLAAELTLTPAKGGITIAKAGFIGTAVSATASGALTGWGKDGEMVLTLSARDLAPLSGLAGRKLAGSLAVEGKLRRTGGQTALVVEGEGKELAAGIPALDPLLIGTTAIFADVAVSEEMLLRRLSLTNPRLKVGGEGRYGPKGIGADLAAEVADLSYLSPALGIQVAGGVTARLKSPSPDTLVLEIAGDGLVVDGLQLVDTKLDAQMAGLPRAPKGRVALETSLNGQRIALSSGIAHSGSTLSLNGIDAVIGLNKIGGDLELDTATGLASGELAGTIPDLGILAFIAGDEVWGNGTLSVQLSHARGQQSAEVKADFKELWRRWHGQKVGAINLAARLDGAAKTPNVDAGFTISGIDAGTLDLDKITGSAKGPLTAVALGFDLSGKRGSSPVKLAMQGQLATGAKDGISRLGLGSLSGAYADTEFRLANPANLSFGNGVVGVQGLVLLAGDARLEANADMSPKGLGGQVSLTRLPLNWVRLIDPTLTLYGHLDGTASLSGTVTDPRGNLNLKLSEFALAPQVLKGPSPLGATLTADWQKGRVALIARIDSAGSGVGLSGRADLPLEMQGAVTNIAVPTDKPISGRLEGNLALRRLDDLLATTGDRLGGQMVLDLTLGGTLAARELTGTVKLDNARYENQRWGTLITDIQAVLKGDPQGLAIEKFEGKTPGGGTVGLSGSFGFRPELGDKQIDLHLTAKRAKLAGIDMVEAFAGADITVTGKPSDMTIAGRVDVAEAHIRIPDKLPPTVVEVKVKEINHPRRVPPPGAVSSADAKAVGAEAPSIVVIRLNIDVEAPNQIYIGGRGLDAELKASLKLRGTTATPLLSGNVALVKGEMGLLGQTFALNRANVTFLGDGSFDPSLDVEAQTQRGDLTAIVTVTGRPSKPTVKLSSQPPYPEDEVLARLLFNRGAGQLSALEAVQLAQSAAQLSGLFGGGPGFVDNVKRSLGVDRLEFRGSEDGSGAGTVAAGRYIGDNIYVGVEQELGTGQSKATVEYGITDHIKARGEVGTESKVGVQFQWDY